MNHKPDNETQGESVGDSLIAKNKKLRALLDGLELTPEQTKDDVAPTSNRDSEILGNVPPHHGD